jgi:hypothetical protein
MKAKYYLKNSIDYINKELLRRSSYDIFINEIKELNKSYNYSIYLYGSYIGYLIEQKPYNDINFIILSEKILEINELTDFFNEFHKICKKHNVVYDLIYSADKKKEDFDNNIFSYSLFNTGNSRVIRLYKSIELDNYVLNPFTPLVGTNLFEGVITSNDITTKIIKKMQTGVKFHYPIKIQ